MPKGAKIIQTLQRWIEDEEERRGYMRTKTPLMAKKDLYEISDHWNHYKEGMFVLGDESDPESEVFALRPMTCPFQYYVYKASQKSYRDLPCRYGETSTLFRNEDSGEMHGRHAEHGVDDLSNQHERAHNRNVQTKHIGTVDSEESQDHIVHRCADQTTGPYKQGLHRQLVLSTVRVPRDLFCGIHVITFLGYQNQFMHRRNRLASAVPFLGDEVFARPLSLRIPDLIY